MDDNGKEDCQLLLKEHKELMPEAMIGDEKGFVLVGTSSGTGGTATIFNIEIR